MKKQFYTQTIIVVLLIFISTTAYSDIITVGTSQDCEYADLQMAIDSGGIDMDIRVSNQLNISSTVSISDKDVINLAGGYNCCADALVDNRPELFTATEIAQATGRGVALFFSNIPVHSIQISGFNIHHNTDDGMRVWSNNDSLIVTIDKVSLYDNDRVGLSSLGENAFISFDNGEIYNNTNTLPGSSGGGIRCIDGNISIGEMVAIRNNTGEKGAGIYANRCDVTLLAGDSENLDSLIYGVIYNTSFDFGGGIYLLASNFLAQGNTLHPASITGNSAILPSPRGKGAGIYYASGSTVTLINTRIDGNTAETSGGGIFGNHYNASLATPVLEMYRSDLGCEYAEICSSLGFNKVLSQIGHGGAISLDQGSQANIYQTKISNNQANESAVAYLFRANSHMFLEGNLITNNSGLDNAGNAVSLIEEKYGSESILNFNTLTDNNAGIIFDLKYNDGSNTPNYFTVYNTIIDNSESIIVDYNGGENNHDGSIECSIIHDNSYGATVVAETIIAEPGIIGNGNYHLKQDSIAIDPTCISNLGAVKTDIRGYNRITDGAADIGAYESIANDDTIFINSFE